MGRVGLTIPSDGEDQTEFCGQLNHAESTDFFLKPGPAWESVASDPFDEVPFFPNQQGRYQDVLHKLGRLTPVRYFL